MLSDFRSVVGVTSTSRQTIRNAGPVFQAAEAALGRDVVGWLAERVALGDSQRELARKLHDLGVIVSNTTISNWCNRFGIEAA